MSGTRRGRPPAKEAADQQVEQPSAQSQPKEPRGVQVGDIVIYRHRLPGAPDDGERVVYQFVRTPDNKIERKADENQASQYPHFVDLPMIVTTVFHDGSTVSGVVFTDDQGLIDSPYAGGSKVVREVAKGEGGGQWTPRQ